MKKIKRLLSILLFTVLVFSFMFSGCGTEKEDDEIKGRLITLGEAYEETLINKENLQEMAARHAHNGLQFFADLPEEIETEIQVLGAEKWRTSSSSFPDITAEDITIVGVWGNYGNCWVVMLMPKTLMWTQEYSPTPLSIGGGVFEFAHHIYLNFLSVYVEV